MNMMCNLATQQNVYIQTKINTNYLCILFLLAKLNFSIIITPVVRVTWSFRNHSKMLIWYSRNNYYLVWGVCLS